jgi:PilZ domain
VKAAIPARRQRGPMDKDKRTARRRPMRYSAWLALGPGETQPCVLSDISDTGARIDVKNPKALPDQFLLFLSKSGSARRACRVIWRKARQIGVKFEHHLTTTDQASLVPTSEGDAEAEQPAEKTEAV